MHPNDRRVYPGHFGWRGVVLLLAVQFAIDTVRCEFQFTVTPQSRQVFEGEPATFECRAMFDDEIDFSWTLNGNPVPVHDRQERAKPQQRIYQSGSNLHIRAVNGSLDRGDYVCLATAKASGARVASPAARLDIIAISPPVVQLLKHDSDRGSISLKCHSSLENVADGGSGVVPPFEEMHVEWYRNEVKLTKSAHIELQRRKLHIKSASSKDNGVYSCLLAFRTDSSHRMALRSVKNYRLKLKPGAAYHGEGKIDCTKNRNLLLCRGKRGDRQLAVPPGSSQDTGAFLGDGAVPAQLQLATEAPTAAAAPVRIVLHPTTTTVNESQPAALNCGFRPTGNGNGGPAPGGGGFVLRWRKDGKVIRRWDNTAEATTAMAAASADDSALASTGATESSSSSAMFRDDARIHVDRTNGSLVFSSTVASDEGSYDCQITNNASDFLVSSMPAELQIISNLRFTPKPPTTKNLELGSIAKIHCKAQGTPTPTVHWTPVAVAGGPRGELPESVEDVNGTLVFRNVSAEHRGNYACVAANSQGEIRATVAVNVVIAPKFEIAPEGSVQVAELGTVQFHCVATGDPKPTIQWDKDLQYLHAPAAGGNGSEEERYRMLENGTLVLTEVHLEDEGRYGCTIGNSAGLKREEVHLIVRLTEGIPGVSEESAEDGFLITRAVLITMSVAFAYIILVVGLMIWCRHRRAARKARLNLGSAKENGGGDVDLKNCEIEPCLPDKSSAGGGGGTGGGSGVENGVAGATSSNRGKKMKNGSAGGGGAKEQQADGQDKSDDTVNSNRSKKSSGSGGSVLEQLAVPRAAVVDLLQIGKCDFGDVLIGKMRENDCRLPPPKESVTMDPITGDEVGAGGSAEVSTEHERKSVGRKPSNEELNAIRPENDYKPVMVKALTKVKDEHCCAEFRRQLELFRTVTHRNVVQLFGLCRDKDPHYLLLEYTDWGDLKQFLLATSPNMPPNGTVDKKDSATKPPPLNIPQILALAHQIGRGMDAIYKARITHKDLATRNCIISSDFSAKISLPALARDKYSKEYCKHRNQLLPVRWMAPECFQEDDHSIKSDIFSFAVLVWELFTNATALPQATLTDEEVIAGALAGKLEWKVADSTPEALHKILTSCWSANAKERPSFSQLVVAIGSCLQSEYPKEPSG